MPQLVAYQTGIGAIPLSSAGPSGKTPAQIRHAYGFDGITFNNGTVVGDGNGTTIAIVDAFDDPNIANDLHQFDVQFGLPDPVFTKVDQNGGTAYPAPNAGWITEIALDVEWAHAVAPKANILLVEANSSFDSDLFAAVDYARQATGVVAVSMSWSSGEYPGEMMDDSHFTTPASHNGVTFLAASGDRGAPVQHPAISSNVVAVGGTTLSVDAAGNWLSETGWSGSGGGISSMVPQPSYQNGVVTQSTTWRTSPDVAYDADPATGFPVYDSYNNGTSLPWRTWGGTSDAAPQWAALIAIADQGRLLAGEGTLDGATQTLPALYAISSGDYRDITSGTSTGNPKYSAGPGYDLVTGRGSPLAGSIVADLIAGLGTNQLAFQQEPPATLIAGTVLSPAVVVDVEDQFGNLITTDNSNVTLTLNTGMFANGSQTVTVQAVNGVATFSGLGADLIINKAGSFQLWASDGTARGTPSSIIAISPANASQTAFQSIPTTGTAGVVLGTAVKVAVEDAFGNIITGDASNVTLGIATGPGVFASGSTLSVAAVNGIATFSKLILDTSGKYTLNAADGSLAVPTSGAITINPAAATHLAILQAPTTGAAGTALTPAVKVAAEDQFGNPVSSSSTVTLTLSSGTFSTGKTTATAGTSGGIATFSSLIFNTPGSYTLNASDGALTGTSFAVTITPGAASKLVFQQMPPAAGTAGVALSPAVVVAVEDKVGNLIATDNTSSVTLTLNTGTFANGSKTVTASVAGGLATFSGPGLDLIINKTGSYKLTASDGTLTPATSGSIAIAPAATSQMAFQSIPATGTAGTVLAVAVKVALKDVFGNIATGDTSTVTLGIATGPGVFASGSTLSVAAVNGIATFSNVILNTSGKYTFTATDGSLPVPTSGTITINPAAATQLVFLQAPATGTAGVALAPAVKVATKDQFGNLVTTSSNVTLTLSSGTFSNGSSSVVIGTSGGVATFSNLIINTAGSYTLTASDGTLTGTSFGVTINPAAASKLVFVQQPPATGSVGIALDPPVLVSVEDKFGNVLAGNNSSVTLTLSSGTFANGSQTVTVQAVNGVASFSSLIINTGGTYTLKASDGALTAATSTSFTIS